MLEVIARASQKTETLAGALTTLLWQFDLLRSVEVLCRDGIGLQHLLWGALEHHLTALAPGTGTDVNDIVGIQHHVLVVFHHDDGVT